MHFSLLLFGGLGFVGDRGDRDEASKEREKIEIGVTQKTALKSSG